MKTSELINALLEKLEGWLVAFVELLPNIALAIILMISFYFIARLVERFSRKYLARARLNQTITRFLSRIFFLIILIGGLMLALSILNLTGTVTSMLAGLGILGLALGFAFQDTAANVMSGIFITFQRPLRIGDVIETSKGIMGNVMDIDLRITKVQTFDGPMVHVPNRFLFQETFTNYTAIGKRRLRVDCRVSYGADLEEVERIALAAMDNIAGRIPNEKATLFWKDFGESAINFSVNIWLKYTQDQKAYISVKNAAIKNLKRAFDDNKIIIPFPIRTVEMGSREEVVSVKTGRANWGSSTSDNNQSDDSDSIDD